MGNFWKKGHCMVPRSNGETKYIMRDLKAISVEGWYNAVCQDGLAHMQWLLMNREKSILLSISSIVPTRHICLTNIKLPDQSKTASYTPGTSGSTERWPSLCLMSVDEIAQCREKNTCATNRASQERSFFCICGRRLRRQEDLTIDLVILWCVMLVTSPGLSLGLPL